MSVLAQRWKGRFMFWLAYLFTVIVGGTLAAIVVALSEPAIRTRQVASLSLTINEQNCNDISEGAEGICKRHL
jgi:hypothetical protein